MNLGKFNEIFGVPTYTRISKSNWIENIYKGRDYWIQTISTSSGQVVFYAITSCDKVFKPNISPNPILRKIVLQESTFSSIGDDPNDIKYYLREATANSYFYNEYSWGNPSQYQTVFVGINDACMPKQEIQYPENRNSLYIENIRDNDIIKFRSAARINTYAETAAFFGKEVFKDYQIGIDRIQIRSLY
ncbi:hypothetical protein A2960_01215 [Candidatus Gottesmanbacteria bacterium RIFCSPLOWO2_01_FULL_39_12b]|uniref:Uncharacterized protein n=1 Tax=Candidatus Gottesmanbacteria bacterium RIFCSPLOWO2_01_FULL_39_12b TaxID=1798388 RepID=A0A1F6AQ09_9BACT|nr:MAG: hypothetical protein A2960_01215 [Candidatus Gottesmanbacteria bacterium RIFCSPLOWO2_01_FULL_39_12b]